MVCIEIMMYEQWCEFNSNNIDCELSETGADREMDFDKEAWLERNYFKYVNQCKSS